MKKVTILIPCYNEQESLPLLHKELCALIDAEPKYSWEILFVNDGSKDNTIQVIKLLSAQDKHISYVDLSRNYGKETAMLAGFDHVQGDACVIMDADLQHPPLVVHEMLHKWEEGYDDVYGKRISRGKESLLRKHLSLTFYKILQNATRVEVLPNVGDFRLLDRKCIDALCQLRESERYTKGLYCLIGFKKTYVEFETQERIAGTSSWSFWSLLGLAIEGLTSFTTAPLRIATGVGGTTALGAFLYALYFFIRSLVVNDPAQGFPTLVILILFFGGLQLLALGILGEYIGRIFKESKHRPNYFVQEYYKNDRI